MSSRLVLTRTPSKPRVTTYSGGTGGNIVITSGQSSTIIKSSTGGVVTPSGTVIVKSPDGSIRTGLTRGGSSGSYAPQTKSVKEIQAEEFAKMKELASGVKQAYEEVPGVDSKQALQIGRTVAGKQVSLKGTSALINQGFTPQEASVIVASKQDASIKSRLEAQQGSPNDISSIIARQNIAKEQRKVGGVATMAQTEIDKASSLQSAYELAVAKFNADYAGKQLGPSDYAKAVARQKDLEKQRALVEQQVARADVAYKTYESTRQESEKNISSVQEKYLKQRERQAALAPLGEIVSQSNVVSDIGKTNVVDARTPIVPEVTQPVKPAGRKPDTLTSVRDKPQGEKIIVETASSLLNKGAFGSVIAGEAATTKITDVASGIKKIGLEIATIPATTGQLIGQSASQLITGTYDPNKFKQDKEFFYKGDFGDTIVTDIPSPNVAISRYGKSLQTDPIGTIGATALAIASYTPLGRIGLTKLSGKLASSKIYSNLLGKGVVQKVDVLLPSKIRGASGTGDDAIAIISKGVVKGKSQVVGTGKFNVGKVYSTKDVFLKTKSKSIYQIDDLIESNIKSVYKKGLEGPKAGLFGTPSRGTGIGTNIKSTYDVSKDIFKPGSRLIEYGSPSALEKVKSSIGTTIFKVKTKITTNGIASKFNTRIGVSAEKARIDVSTLLSKEDVLSLGDDFGSIPITGSGGISSSSINKLDVKNISGYTDDIISEQIKSVLKLKGSNATSKFPSSFVQSNLIETKTDLGQRIVGKLKQFYTDISVKGNVARISKVDVSANVSVIPKVRSISVLDDVPLGVSFKGGIGKKSSKDFFEQLAKTSSKTPVSKELSRVEVLKLLEKQTKPITGASKTVSSSTGTGSKLLSKTKTSNIISGTVQKAIVQTSEKTLSNVDYALSGLATSQLKTVSRPITSQQLVGLKLTTLTATKTPSFSGVNYVGGYGGVGVTITKSDTGLASYAVPSTKTLSVESVQLLKSLQLQDYKQLSEVSKLNLQKTDTLGITKTKSLDLIRQDYLTSTKTLTDTKTKVDTLTRTDTRTLAKTRVKTLTKTLTKTMVKPMTRVAYTQRVTPPVPPVPTIFPSLKFGPYVGSKLKGKKQLGFEVEVKKKGKFISIGKNLPKNIATLLGARIAKETSVRTFRLTPSGYTTQKDIAGVNLSQFRNPIGKSKSLKGFSFVEKTRYAIDSPIEKLEIPGQAKKKRKTKRRKSKR